MASVVYGQTWNEDLRFIIDHISADDARRRFLAGPWFGLGVGEGLCTSADDARAAEAAGVSLPVPEFSLEMEAGATAVRVLFYDEQNSITTLHDWGIKRGQLFLETVVLYVYPDDPRFHRRNERLMVRSIDFAVDGSAREIIKDTFSAATETYDRSKTIIEHRDVPLGNHYIPIPEFGDWAALGHRDRYLPPGGKA
jgi:hypothetical protein